MYTYNSDIRNEKILSFQTPWMDLEGIMLSKSDRERQIRMISYMVSKKKKYSQEKRSIRPVVTKGEGWGERKLEKGGQKVQTSSYKINKYQGCNVQHEDYS